MRLLNEISSVQTALQLLRKLIILKYPNINTRGVAQIKVEIIESDAIVWYMESELRAVNLVSKKLMID